MTGCYMMHGSVYQTCMEDQQSGLDTTCAFRQAVCPILESQRDAKRSAPDVKQLQLLQAGQESQCGMCYICPG